MSHPTLEMLKLQCAKTGLPDDEAQHFLDYYESNGWRVGRNPMKSWTGALSNWKRNFDKRRFEGQANGQPAKAAQKSILEKDIEASTRWVQKFCQQPLP